MKQGIENIKRLALLNLVISTKSFPYKNFYNQRQNFRLFGEKKIKTYKRHMRDCQLFSTMLKESQTLQPRLQVAFNVASYLLDKGPG